MAPPAAPRGRSRPGSWLPAGPSGGIYVVNDVVVVSWGRGLRPRLPDVPRHRLGAFRNRWLVYATLLAIALQLMVVYVPFFQTAFGTVPIGLDLWGIALLAGGSMFAIEDTRKKLFPRLFSLGKWHPARSAR